jgi:BlaI family transcriptional regulator, penicillinase repressor
VLILGSEGDASPEKEAGFSSFAAVAVLYEQDILRDDRVLNLCPYFYLQLHPAHHGSRITHEHSRSPMTLPKLTKLELQIMEALWSRGACSIREIQEAFPERGRPAYTTIQTTVYRLEDKKALRRAKKISNAHIFEAVISRNAAQSRLIDDLLGLFGGRTQPVMSHLIESGRLTLDDIHEAEKSIRKLARKDAEK